MFKKLFNMYVSHTPLIWKKVKMFSFLLAGVSVLLLEMPAGEDGFVPDFIVKISDWTKYIGVILAFFSDFAIGDHSEDCEICKK